MIYTVTFNPALDYIVSVPDFQIGQDQPVCGRTDFSGRKGSQRFHCSEKSGREEHRSGLYSRFRGGRDPAPFETFRSSGRVYPLNSGCSRINFKWKESEGTEINGKGPEIPKEALEELLRRLNRLEKTDILVLAGSIPECLPKTIYRTF